MAEKNNLNNVVWAKLRYCPYWPAQIVEPPLAIKMKVPPRKFCVLFFGSNNYGIVPACNVESYVQNRLKYKKRGRGNGFHKAVQECEDFLDCHMEFNSVEARDEVIIKKEFDFVIKTEKESDVTDDGECAFICSSETIKLKLKSICSACDFKDAEISLMHNDKIKLISDLTASKQECQKYYADSKKNERLTVKIKADFDALLKSNKEEKLKNQNLTKQNEEYIHERQQLTNRIKILESNNYGVYEIERIVGHELFGKKRKYLIEWKGYDESSNTWEPEEKIKSLSILKKYKKVHNLN